MSAERDSDEEIAIAVDVEGDSVEIERERIDCSAKPATCSPISYIPI
ncbi:hypothetical protein [Halorubrum sp. FL23]